MEKALHGGFSELLIDIFIKLNFMSFLNTELDKCLNREGGPKTRYEERTLYIKQIIFNLKRYQHQRDLQQFYNVISRMGTYKRMCSFFE
jgi:hypothetical protein